MKINCKLRNRAGAASPGSASRGERVPKVVIFDKLLEIEEASDKITLLKYIYSTKNCSFCYYLAKRLDRNLFGGVGEAEMNGHYQGSRGPNSRHRLLNKRGISNIHLSPLI